MNIESVEASARRGASEAALQEVYHTFAHWRLQRVEEPAKGDTSTTQDKRRPEGEGAESSQTRSDQASHRQGLDRFAVEPEGGVLNDLPISDSLLETMRRIARRLVQHYFGIKMGDEASPQAQRVPGQKITHDGDLLSAAVVASDGRPVRADLEVRDGDRSDAPPAARRKAPALSSSASADDLDGWQLRFTFKRDEHDTAREATVTFRREDRTDRPAEKDLSDVRLEQHVSASFHEVARERQQVEQHVAADAKQDRKLEEQVLAEQRRAEDALDRKLSEEAESLG